MNSLRNLSQNTQNGLLQSVKLVLLNNAPVFVDLQEFSYFIQKLHMNMHVVKDNWSLPITNMTAKRVIKPNFIIFETIFLSRFQKKIK